MFQDCHTSCRGLEHCPDGFVGFAQSDEDPWEADKGAPNKTTKQLHEARFRFGAHVVIQVLFYRLSFLIRQIVRKESNYNRAQLEMSQLEMSHVYLRVFSSHPAPARPGRQEPRPFHIVISYGQFTYLHHRLFMGFTRSGSYFTGLKSPFLRCRSATVSFLHCRLDCAKREIKSTVHRRRKGGIRKGGSDQEIT